jgi:hypothetical protein
MFALVITLVVSACAIPSQDKLASKIAELQKANPTAKVSVRFDQRCMKAAQFNSRF